MSENNVPSAPAGADGMSGMDFLSLLRLVRIRWWWLATSIVIFPSALGVAAFLLHPVYRATSVLVPVDPVRSSGGSLSSMLGQFGGLASLAGVNIGSGGAETEVTLAVLKSRAFTERFIKDHDLLPLLYAKQWDKSRKEWRGRKESWPTLARAAKYMDREIRAVSYDRRSGLVTIQVDWSDPGIAAVWVNDMVDRVNEEMRQRARNEATAALTHLQKELESTQTVETRAAVSRLIEAQVNQKMLANVSAEYAFRVIDRALPADATDPVRPRRALMVAVGFALGALIGMLAIIIVPRKR